MSLSARTRAGVLVILKLFPWIRFSLNFAKIEFEYKPQKADGTADAAVKGGWDIKANKPT